MNHITISAFETNRNAKKVVIKFKGCAWHRVCFLHPFCQLLHGLYNFVLLCFVLRLRYKTMLSTIITE